MIARATQGFAVPVSATVAVGDGVESVVEPGVALGEGLLDVVGLEVGDDEGEADSDCSGAATLAEAAQACHGWAIRSQAIAPAITSTRSSRSSRRRRYTAGEWRLRPEPLLMLPG